MRAYQQLETCSAPDGDLGLQPCPSACLSACWSVHTVACSHNDTLIHPGLSHHQPLTIVACPDIKMEMGGIGDVNGENANVTFDKVINCCFCSGCWGCTRVKYHLFFNLSQVEEEHINMLSHM